MSTVKATRSARVEPERETFHGIPVLSLRVGDEIPTPRAPERYAVRVYPDLARYLLTFNAPNNRGIRQSRVTRYALDMRGGLWRFTPEGLVFTRTPQMHNGQHRLHAVVHYGGDVWMVLDLGWPDDIINALDRGAAKTPQDAMRHDGVPNATMVTSAIGVIARYEQVVGQTRGFSGLATPSSLRSLELHSADPDGWAAATRAGSRVYDALDKGFVPSVWTAAYRLIGDVHPDLVEPFFEAIAKGTEDFRSPTRQLADWARRRPLARTKTGDSREPIEVIIRAFNAWRQGKSMAFPKVAGFTLSRVR